MGRGLPIICGYDKELYKPTTFYIHEEFQYPQDFVDTLSEDFDQYTDTEEYIDSLVCGFRESGIVISEGRHAKIVTSTESDDESFVVAIIPLSIEQVLEDDLYLLPQEKDKVLEDKDLNIIYNRYLEKYFKPEEEKFFKFLKETYPNTTKHVGSPWCSGPAFTD